MTDENQLPSVSDSENFLESEFEAGGEFSTISEVADEIHVPQHVLRFWETRFEQVRPLKRLGGRRYYSKQDLELLRYISQLLYRDGHTVKAVQRILAEEEAKVSAQSQPEAAGSNISQSAENDPVTSSDAAMQETIVSSETTEKTDKEQAAAVSREVSEVARTAPVMTDAEHTAHSSLSGGVSVWHKGLAAEDHMSDEAGASQFSEGESFSHVDNASVSDHSDDINRELRRVNERVKHELTSLLFELEAMRDIFLQEKYL
ncbi:MerR family transcriptional regulator [Acetobacter sp. DmW_043]|uniref:MerR family transcriptional regulator n=1 Tax=Acetobacter sp. DmW_043 TaxID=1670658 RepID=UPI000A3A9347|nr:MerR family transcriptional regulator [Acetobacter sp. DmW_043]